MLILRKPWAIGILLLFVAEITEEFVVLSATLNDVRKLAKKFVSDDLAENIVDFIVQATMNMGQKVEQEGTLRHISRKDPSISSGEPVLGGQKIAEDQSGSSEASDSKEIQYIGQTRNVLRTVTTNITPDTTSSPTNKKLQAKLTKPTKSHRDPSTKDSSKEKLSQEDKNSKEKTKGTKKHGKFNFKIHSKKTKQHHETTPKGSNEKDKRLSKEDIKSTNRHVRINKDSQTPSKTKHKSAPSKDSDHKDRANKEETKTKHSKRNKATKRKKDKRNKQKHSKTSKKALRNREPNENEDNKSKTNYHQLPMYKQKLEQLPNVPWLKPQNTKVDQKPSSDAMETKKERKVQDANATSSNESSGRIEKPTNLINHKIKLSVKSDATKVNTMQTDVKKPGKRSQESSGSSSEGSSTADEGQGGTSKGIKSAKKPNKDESSSSGSSEPNSSPAPPIAVPKSVNLNGGQAFYARASVMETDAPSYESEEDSSSYEDYRRSHKSKKSKKKTKTNSRSKKKKKDKTL